MRRLLLVVALTAIVVAGAVLVARGGPSRPTLHVTPRHLLTACTSADCDRDGATLTWTTIHWAHPTTGYYVFLNGTKQGSTTRTSWSFAGMDCGAVFTLAVRAHDGSGETSPAYPLSYTTPSCSGPTINYYVSQSGAGSHDGSSCANPEPASWLNSSANWGAGAGQIGPGKTVGLCGRITSQLVAHGSGAIGDPITIYWEPNAALSESVCPSNGGCFNTNGQTYLTLNGGQNGLIASTANGSGLANRVGAAVGIAALACTGCTIEHLTVEDMYQHTSDSDGAIEGDLNLGIEFSGSNVTLADNTLHDEGWAIRYMGGYGESCSSSCDSNVVIVGNDVYNIDHGLTLANNGNFNLGPVFVYDNHVHDEANWDVTSRTPCTGNGGGTGDCYHHDGLHCFSATGYGSGNYTGLYIYDNRFDGNSGGNMSSEMYIEGRSGPTCGGASTKPYVFNNVIVPQQTPADGDLGVYGTGVQAYNNTLVGSSSSGAGAACYINDEDTSTGLAFENNVVSTCNLIAVTSGSMSPGQPDHNVYDNGGGNGNAFDCAGTYTSYSSPGFSAWKSNCRGDSHSCAINDGQWTGGGTGLCAGSPTSVGLNRDESPGPGSPVLGAGANLTTSVCSTLPRSPVNVESACDTSYTGPPLNGAAGSTTSGRARPSSGAWNAGAY